MEELVREDLDLSAILGSDREEWGHPRHHPAMMTALLLYACSRGIRRQHPIAANNFRPTASARRGLVGDCPIPGAIKAFQGP